MRPVAFLALCGLLTSVSLVSTQGGDIRGSVKDSQGGAVPGATVIGICRGAEAQAVTDEAGDFTLPGLPNYTCSVLVEAPYFQAVRRTVQPNQRVIEVVIPVSSFETSVQVTAGRGVQEERRKLPQASSVLTREGMNRRSYQILPQALREETGVFVQQTSSGHGSPTIRGFTGQSNVYLLDGVRFNTASWRSGPSQYFAWVNGDSVDRIEVVRGPGSVGYGSDALGGTINVLSARPAFTASGVKVSGDFGLAGGTGERSGGGDVNLTLQTPRFAVRGGTSGRTVGDLRPGGGRDSRATVVRLLGLPMNFNGDRLPSTGYDQMGGYVTGQARLAPRTQLEFLYSGTSLTGSSRYDRIDGGAGLFKSYYDPQRLDFTLARVRQRGAAGFDELNATFSVNRQSDSAIEQTRPTAVRDQQSSVTTVYGYQAQGQKAIAGRHQITAGAEFYDEQVSDARREQVNPVTGAVTVLRPDIPDGTSYRSLGVFAQDAFDLVPGRLHVRGGARYGRFSFATTPNAALGVVDESVTSDAFTYQAGTVVTVSKYVDVTGNVSRGFRAPNSSDLGGVGLSGGGGFSIAPSRAAALGGLVGTTLGTDARSTGQAVPSLTPEVMYAYEGGARVHVGRVESSVTLYQLNFKNSVQRRAIVFPSNVVGQSLFGFDIVRQDAAGLAYIAQDIRPVNTSINADQTIVRGVEAEVGIRIGANWNAFANVATSNGHLESTGEFTRRMTPPIGAARLRWAKPRTWIEGAVVWAAAQTRLNPADLTDARIGAVRTRAQIASYFNGTATDLGLVQGGVLVATGESLAQVQNRVLGTAASAPLYTQTAGFAIVNLRGGVTVTRNLDVTVIGENLADTNYRIHGSGVDGVGRNLVVRTRVSF